MTSNEAAISRRAYFVGIALVLAAAVLWSLNGVLIKSIYDEGRGPHGVIIAFYRSLFAGLFLIPLARGKFHTLRRDSKVDSRNSGYGIHNWVFGLRPAGICCIIFFTLMTVCFVVANTKTEAANAIILQYTSTFWVFGLSPFILKEHPRLRDLWILVAAIVGIIIIFVGNAGTDLLGLVNALGSGLFYGLLTMMLRLLRSSAPAAVTVMNNLGSALLILPFAMVMGGLMVSSGSWLLLVIIGVVQFGVPYYLFSLGLGRVPAYQAALITLAEPILVPVWTYLVLGEKVPPSTMVGGAMILLSLVAFVITLRGAADQPVKAVRTQK
jgi:DME family drug/metabolite transporter